MVIPKKKKLEVAKVRPTWYRGEILEAEVEEDERKETAISYTRT